MQWVPGSSVFKAKCYNIFSSTYQTTWAKGCFSINTKHLTAFWGLNCLPFSPVTAHTRSYRGRWNISPSLLLSRGSWLGITPRLRGSKLRRVQNLSQISSFTFKNTHKFYTLLCKVSCFSIEMFVLTQKMKITSSSLRTASFQIP